MPSSRTHPILLALVLGCAPASTGVPGGDSTQERISTGPGASLTVIREADITAVPLDGTPASHWGELVELYRTAGLRVTEADPDSRTLYGEAPRARRIAGEPVSRFFHCPGTAYGNSATSDQVHVAVGSQLLPGADGGTELRIRVEASTVVTGGGSSRCRTTGRLEQLMGEALAEERDQDGAG